MKFTVLILFFFIALTGWSQAPVIPDSTFNGTGRNIFSVGGNLDYGQKIAVQTDGSIIMTGITLVSDTYKLGITRLTSAGTTDSTFGTDGVTIVDLGQLTNLTNLNPSVLVQDDGTILVSGINQVASPANTNFFVCKLLGDGTLDPSFGTAGKASIDLTGTNKDDVSYAFTTDATGNIYICGATRTGATPMSNDLAVVKLTPAGTLDPAFSGDGNCFLM